jgi:plastocyanin
MRLAAPALAAALSLVGVSLAAPAWAGDLVVALRQADGKPVADAVVMVRVAGAHGPAKFSWPMRMSQRNMQFDPFVLIVPAGTDVVFPNFDTVLHHVYSFSPAKTFELKLYGRDQARSVNLDKPGVVAIGCNIHDDMSAYIRVVDTPYAAKSTADGQAIIRGLPAGPATVTIWHPYLKAPKNELSQAVTVPASGDVNLSLKADLRPARLRKGDY